MEATGCRLAMTGHSTLVIVGLSPVSKTVAPARPKSPLCLRGCRHPLRIPNDIASTDEIDLAIGALTNHVRTVVEESGGSGILGSPEVSARYSRIDKAKTQLCAARAYHSRVQIQSASFQREVKARVREFRNESWSDLMEIKPSHKAFWAVTKALKTEGYTLYPTQKPDNSVAIDDAEIAECLADSIETQCSHASPPHDIAHISRIEEEVLQNTSSNPKTIWLPSHSAKSKR
ncbi:hypothetical protein EVAR_44179_1 [Eumeta japonica]|uniref:Uncharacterized protein n=1 Tax=Eumeta variegata TaxID=151549 RepID=A0A4C1W0Q1_EUMVA|nr:hypothetical protein EVAR_44179_1 [Eumeta japonica]